MFDIVVIDMLHGTELNNELIFEFFPWRKEGILLYNLIIAGIIWQESISVNAVKAVTDPKRRLHQHLMKSETTESKLQNLGS